MRNNETAGEDDDQYRRMDSVFQPVKQAFGSSDSLRAQVGRRIAVATMQPPRLISARAVVACSVAAAIAIVCSAVWFSVGRHAASPGAAAVPGPSVVASPVEADFALEIGNAEVVQHLATTVDGGAVVVVWSYRGPGMSVDDSASSPQRIGKYRVLTRHGHPSTDGRTTVCSLFFPDAGVLPALQPPGVRVRSADDGRAIIFTAVPRTASLDELARATRAAGATDVEDVLRQVREQIR